MYYIVQLVSIDTDISYPSSVSLCLIRPVLLYNDLLIDLAHGIALDPIHNFQNSWDLVRSHLVLELSA